MFKIRNLLSLVLVQVPLVVFAFSTTSEVIGNVPLDQNLNLSGYLPQNLKKVPEVLISRDQYVISFNQETRLLNWAAWKLELSDIGHIGRANNFLADVDLQAYLNKFGKQAVQPTDYFDSCFDRGHQVPSADRDTTLEVNQITFLMSNMMPQTAYLNRSIWEHLESYTRDLVVNQNKKVYIVAGPIYDEDFGKIGPNKDIPVPSKNFKLLIVLNSNQTLSDINSGTQIIPVIIPNLLRTGEKPMNNKTELCSEAKSKPKPPAPPTSSIDAPPIVATAEPPPIVAVLPPAHPLNDDWKKYEVSLDEIEKLSGFRITHNFGDGAGGLNSAREQN